jgi:arylformamidase
MRECIARHRDQLPQSCFDAIAARLRSSMGQRERDKRPQLEEQAKALGAVEHRYGSETAHRLDFYRADAPGRAPLVVFVHGGGWSRGDKRNATGFEKIRHLRERGYHFASIDYRLVPAATVEQQAGDVALALAWLRKEADALRIDATRIVLMGHSAGATSPACCSTVAAGTSR